MGFFNYLRTKKWDAFDFLEALLLLYPFKVLFQALFDTNFRVSIYTSPFGYALFIILILALAASVCFIAYMYFRYSHSEGAHSEDVHSENVYSEGAHSVLQRTAGKGKKPHKLLLLLFTLGIVLFIAVTLDLAKQSFAQDCIVPKSDMLIDSNAVFCSGEYFTGGITLSGDSIILDCNNAVLSGGGSSKGIIVENSNKAKLVNCRLQGFDIALYVRNSTMSELSGSFSKSRVGVRLVDSFENKVQGRLEDNIIGVDVINSKFNSLSFDVKLAGSEICKDNICDEVKDEPCFSGDGYCSELCPVELDNDCEQVSSQNSEAPAASSATQIASSAISSEGIRPLSPELALEYYELRMKEKALQLLNTLTGHDEAKRRVQELLENGRLQVANYVDPELRAALFKQLGISDEQYQQALRELEIQKYVYVADNRTIFEITVVAKGKTENLVLYEYFPEGLDDLVLPENAKEAPLNASNSNVKADVYSIFLGKLEVDASTKVRFSAGKDAFFKQLPQTIPVDDIIEDTRDIQSPRAESVGLGSNFSSIFFWLQIVLAYLCSFFFVQYVKYRISLGKNKKSA